MLPTLNYNVYLNIMQKMFFIYHGFYIFKQNIKLANVFFVFKINFNFFIHLFLSLTVSVNAIKLKIIKHSALC